MFSKKSFLPLFTTIKSYQNLREFVSEHRKLKKTIVNIRLIPQTAIQRLEVTAAKAIPVFRVAATLTEMDKREALSGNF